MTRTSIEWVCRPEAIPESWNFIGGCTKVSPGCDNCYALAMSWRLQNNPKAPKRYEGVIQAMYFRLLGGGGSGKELDWSGRVNLDWDALETPYRWKKPRTVFVCSMADLFHEKVEDHFLLTAFKAMSDNPAHTFLVLTKRHERMQAFFHDTIHDMLGAGKWRNAWPLPNVWLGVTAENQEQADLRIPYLLQTPAAVRWVSVEPMLGAIDAWQYLGGERNPIGPAYGGRGLDWVVIGAESGPNRRPFSNSDAVRLIEQCDSAGVPVFVKRIDGDQAGVRQNIEKWPPKLRRSEWPK